MADEVDDIRYTEEQQIPKSHKPPVLSDKCVAKVIFYTRIDNLFKTFLQHDIDNQN